MREYSLAAQFEVAEPKDPTTLLGRIAAAARRSAELAEVTDDDDVSG
jgi:hypothetical protein